MTDHRRPAKTVSPSHCGYDGPPVRPPFPLITCFFAVLPFFFTAPIFPLGAVSGAPTLLMFTLWRNAKATCPECCADPSHRPRLQRTHQVGWHTESYLLTAITTACFVQTALLMPTLLGLSIKILT